MLLALAVAGVGGGDGQAGEGGEVRVLGQLPPPVSVSYQICPARSQALPPSAVTAR